MDNESEFGDFDDQDALNDSRELTPEQWVDVETLQQNVDAIRNISDAAERKTAAKLWVRQLNGAV